MTNVSSLPTGVVFDLDSETRDPKDVIPPFVANVGGKPITFDDPNEMDWRDLAEMEAPGDIIRLALSREDRDHVAKLGLPAWKFNRLMEAYYAHYGLEEKIREARRQAALKG